MFLKYRPYFAPSAIDFLQWRMYRCSFAPGAKLIFPRSKQALLPLRLERRVGEKQRRISSQMILGAILVYRNSMWIVEKKIGAASWTL